MRGILLASFLFFSALLAESTPIFPLALQKGDLIAFVFPASFLKMGDEEAEIILNKKAAWLQLQGYRTIFYEDEREHHQPRAGG